ncbi:MAG: HIT domain-containing protein [bacterium]|nr:HIT domain-containing protein [bacterium]
MQTLWAPWRLSYILSEKERGCVFCRKLQASADDRRNFVLYRGTHAFALLNIYPYNNGHLMIAPYAHVSHLADLDDSQIAELFQIARRCEQVLGQALHPEGFNVGINLGKAAGAGIEEHLHVHIVPRWNGDTNYMTSISKTRVIPQELNDSYDILHPLFHSSV